MGRIDGDYEPRPPKKPVDTFSSKSILKVTRLTESDYYSKGYDYEIVVFLSFSNPSEEESGVLAAFKRDSDVESYAGRDLYGLEVYKNPDDFEKTWKLNAKISFEENKHEEFKGLKLKVFKPLNTIVSELDNEIK